MINLYLVNIYKFHHAHIGGGRRELFGRGPHTFCPLWAAAISARPVLSPISSPVKTLNIRLFSAKQAVSSQTQCTQREVFA